ncbi:hypothetical protein GCM10017691_26360 [Pseudonocardia petroleophila]
MTAVRRSQRSGSVAQVRSSGVSGAGWARSSGPIRREAISSVKSHHAPVTIQCRYSGTQDASWDGAQRRCPVRVSAT